MPSAAIRMRQEANALDQVIQELDSMLTHDALDAAQRTAITCAVNAAEICRDNLLLKPVLVTAFHAGLLSNGFEEGDAASFLGAKPPARTWFNR